MARDPEQPGATDLTGPLVTAMPETSPPAEDAPVDPSAGVLKRVI